MSDRARHAADSELTRRAVALAEDLLVAARAEETAAERNQAQKLARMMEDPWGKELTIDLIDQAFRSRRPARIADQLRYLLERYGAPRYMEWWERMALTVGGLMSHYLPSVVVPPIISRLRHETQSVILPGEEEELRRYLQERRAAGTRLNLNLLGEAILGEAEASRRLDAYLGLLARDDVEYISVKISSIVSQIDLVAFRHTVELIKARLRVLYRQAWTHHYEHPDGRVTPKFINLDMEEYRDLDLTVTAFREVLEEPEFVSLSTGLVLQAYLPDAHPVQRALTAWARERVERGGAPIKIRVVKGANLAMERVEASRHGWPQAPYPTKREVDANYTRMIEYGCRAEHARAVHLGIASHNLFTIAHGLLLRERHGVAPWVEFEMLEGMANHQARVVQARAGGLLLYAPVVKAEDFHSAIAYLVRRLDENTAEGNFLRDLFGMEPGSPAWASQRDQFLAALALTDQVSDRPRRMQNRLAEPATSTPVASGGGDPSPADGFELASEAASTPRGPSPEEGTPFANEADTDWSLPPNRAWIAEVVSRWRSLDAISIPPAAGTTPPPGGRGPGGQTGVAAGHDPSRPERIAYRYALADTRAVDRALAVAEAAQRGWAGSPTSARRRLLHRCADALARRRGELIGAMMLDGAKTVAEADPEVSEAIDFARYYADSFDSADELADCRLEPLGVVVVTTPWNFPLSIPAGGVLAALMAGNSVILKPAPEAVLVGYELARTLWDAGVPPDVLQFLPAPDTEVGQALITDPRVGAVILTGSASTARMFLDWRPDLRLFAETSGKNSMVITALADRDQAIRDLVQSAFGHNGQKCSAASLAICEAEVYEDDAFRRQLRDAAASLPVGSAWDPPSRITPLTQPPGPELRRALTTLDEGEAWLLEPRQVAGNPRLWSPGIKLGVRPGSFFHQTECFGPVLGLMRTEDLDEAIRLANGTAYGLTSGLQSLDEREVARWQEGVEAGNLYVNRPTTGAIVRRQPFGGWKGSVFGPGAKAGGPNYVLQLARWYQVRPPELCADLAPGITTLLPACLAEVARPSDSRILRASAASYAHAWQAHFSREHDPSLVLGERNVFRYRRTRAVLARAVSDTPESRLALCQVLLAARTCGVALTVSLPPGVTGWAWLEGEDGVALTVEDEAALIERLGTAGAPERLRVWEPIGRAVRIAANRAHVAVIDAPILATGRLELRWYLREQTVSRVVHRYGDVIGSPPGVRATPGRPPAGRGSAPR